LAKENATSPSNKIVLKPGMRVGYPAAEDDLELLRECFLDSGALSQVLDVNDPGSVVLGRTGSGKSAILIHIRETQDHVITINPSDLALNYISSSTILRFFDSLGVQFDLFFRLLWRHVLCVELLNYHYKVRKKGDFEKVVEGLHVIFGQAQSKRLALEYLSEWGSHFWEQSQERIKELVEKFEDQLKAGVNLTTVGAAIDIGASTKIESSKKTEIVEQATKVVNTIQIKKLSTLMDLMSKDIFTDDQRRYYVVIDQLDDSWVEDGLRYKLIRALIETVKDFKKVDNVKILIAMRTDLLERVYKFTRDSGFQEEKYEALNVPVRWSRNKLFELIDKRVSWAFKKKYTKDSVHFYDIFERNYRQTGDVFDYIVNRTQMRPRDIIAFINLVF